MQNRKGPNCLTAIDFTQKRPALQLQDPPIPETFSAVAEVCYIINY